LPRKLRKPLGAALKAHRKVWVPMVVSATNPSGGATRVKRAIRIVG
jgi:hypothetical protein